MSQHPHQTTPQPQRQPQRNGRVITTDADYDDAHEWLQAALATTILTTTDSHSMTMANAYLVGKALRPCDDDAVDQDADGNDTAAVARDDAAGDASPAGGSGTLAFALLAFLIGGVIACRAGALLRRSDPRLLTIITSNARWASRERAKRETVGK